jgi:hypothetical protein
MIDFTSDDALRRRLNRAFDLEVHRARGDLRIRPLAVATGRPSSVASLVAIVSMFTMGTIVVAGLSLRMASEPNPHAGGNTSTGPQTAIAETQGPTSGAEPTGHATEPGAAWTGATAGQPIDVSSLPAPSDCDGRLRADIDAAVSIRESLHVHGLATGREAAIAAAADPSATLDEVGIPITAHERELLLTDGPWLSDGLPMDDWVWYGAPDRFGGLWIDPPGSEQYVVSIVDASSQAIELARCVAALTGLQTRYVVARVSYRDGMALSDRIAADLPRLFAEDGIIAGVHYDQTSGVVVIGVDKPTQAMIDRLKDLYGQGVRVVDQEPMIPA